MDGSGCFADFQEPWAFEPFPGMSKKKTFQKYNIFLSQKQTNPELLNTTVRASACDQETLSTYVTCTR